MAPGPHAHARKQAAELWWPRRQWRQVSTRTISKCRLTVSVFITATSSGSAPTQHRPEMAQPAARERGGARGAPTMVAQWPVTHSSMDTHGRGAGPSGKWPVTPLSQRPAALQAMRGHTLTHTHTITHTYTYTYTHTHTHIHHHTITHAGERTREPKRPAPPTPAPACVSPGALWRRPRPHGPKSEAGRRRWRVGRAGSVSEALTEGVAAEVDAGRFRVHQRRIA
jgi:hypothetical protein